jgi:hypothetical protein
MLRSPVAICHRSRGRPYGCVVVSWPMLLRSCSCSHCRHMRPRRRRKVRGARECSACAAASTRSCWFYTYCLCCLCGLRKARGGGPRSNGTSAPGDGAGRGAGDERGTEAAVGGQNAAGRYAGRLKRRAEIGAGPGVGCRDPGRDGKVRARSGVVGTGVASKGEREGTRCWLWLAMRCDAMRTCDI